MSRILYLSQLIPYPPDAGPKVRSYHALRYLAERHEVTLIAFSRPDDRTEAVEHLRTLCQAVHTVPMRRSKLRDAEALLLSLLTGQPFVIRRDAVEEMRQRVESELQNAKFDYIHADQLWMAQYAIRAKGQVSGIKFVLDEHNACFQIFQRLAEGERNPLKRLLLEREWRTLKRYEAWACGQFDHVVTVTKEDRDTLGGLKVGELEGGKVATFHVIPICVDTEALKPVRSRPDAKDVLHLGTMFFLPNVEGVLWFVQQVWPRVQRMTQGLRLTIVGKNPPEAVKKLANSSPQAAEIRITGYVVDPTPYLEQAGVFIVPLHSGSGMRVKIVEAWARGLPVVSTKVGAEGLRYIDGENILIADGAEAFAEAVAKVLNDPELNRRLRENGRRWVVAHYDWRQVYTAWDAIY